MPVTRSNSRANSRANSRSNSREPSPEAKTAAAAAALNVKAADSKVKAAASKAKTAAPRSASPEVVKTAASAKPVSRRNRFEAVNPYAEGTVVVWWLRRGAGEWVVASSNPTLRSITRAEAAPLWCGPVTPWLI